MASLPRHAGNTLILFADDPAKVPETWDLTIILPEALLRMEGEVRVGLLPPAVARSLATRYGIRIWPALLALRDGDYLGTIEGLKDWSSYVRLIARTLVGAAIAPAEHRHPGCQRQRRHPLPLERAPT
jgi:hydrogenase-1 operon protein HyaE